MKRPGADNAVDMGIDMSGGATPFGKFERKIAARYLGAKKKDGGVGMIALISFSCIFLAIFAMITIMSIMNGFRGTVVELTIGVDGHMYVGSAAANPTQLQIVGLRDRISAVEGVENAFLFSQTETAVQAARTMAAARVIGISRTDLEELDVVSSRIITGSLDEFGAGHNGGDKVVIGAFMANNLGLTAGDKLTIYSPVPKSTPFGFRPVMKSYEVAAVFSTGLFTADMLNIYMPINQASLFFYEGQNPTDIQLRLSDADMIHKLKSKVRDAAGEPIWLETWEDKDIGTATALKTEQVAMRLIFMIVVLISVFPVLSSMIMLVKNKSKDIAILKTIGAPSGSILRIFLMAGAAIGVLGTLAGLVAGLLLCLNIGAVQGAIESVISLFTEHPYQLFPPEVYGIDHLPAKVEYGEVFWVSFWGFLAATLATYFPALAASKTDPVEALRYE